MTNPFAPKEDAFTIFLERSFLAGDFISGVGYGVQLVLYPSCAFYLWETRNSLGKSKFLLVYITILITIETMYQIVQARTVELIYVDNRDYPGGPWKYFLATQNLPVNVLYLACYVTLTALSDFLVLWRCWVIWSAFGRLQAILVLSFPALLLLASLAMGVLWVLQSSQPGLSFYSALPIAYGTSYYTLSFGANVVLTVLIIGRLMAHRHSLLKSMPKDQTTEYASLATTIIESAAIYSVFAICFLVTYAMDHPLNQVFFGLADASQIANYLIIYLVAQGRGWNSKPSSSQIDFASRARRARFPPERMAQSMASGTTQLSFEDKA